MAGIKWWITFDEQKWISFGEPLRLGYVPEPEMASVSLHDGIVTAASMTLGKTPPVMITISSRHPVKNMSVAVLCSGGVALLPDPYAGAIVIKREGQKDEQRSISTEKPLLLELKNFLEYLHNGCQPRCGFEMTASVSSSICKIKHMAKVLPSHPLQTDEGP